MSFSSGEVPLPRNADWLRRESTWKGTPDSGPPAVYISEVCATGLPGFIDRLGHPHDWAEFANRTGRPLNLAGYSLSDSRFRPGRWAFPGEAVIPAGGHYLVWLSGTGEGHGLPGIGKAWPHAGFKLGRSGETLVFFDPRGRVIDYVTTRDIPPGKTLARAPEEEGGFREAAPTPLGRAVLPRIGADRESGYYPEGTTVALRPGAAEGTVRCTKDGRNPSPSSPVCEERMEVRVTTVLKARLFREGSWPGPLLVRTFWVEPAIPPALLILTVDPGDLYSPERGIIANQDGKGPAWERPVWVTFMEGGRKVFEGQAGIRLQGKSTRKLPEKSFRLRFRPSWGSAGESYAFFEGEGGRGTRNLLVRAAADYSTVQDWREGRYCPNPVADPLVYGMMRACGVPAPRTRYAVVAFNGEVYGVSILTEEVDRVFLESRFGHANFDLFQVHTDNPVKLGSTRRYDQVRDLVYSRHSEDRKAYARSLYRTLPTFMDMDSLGRWLSVVSFAAVRDHKQGYYIRDRSREDSLLRQVAYDMDSAFLRRWKDPGSPEAWEVNELREIKLDKTELRGRALRPLLEEIPGYRREFAMLFQELVNHRLRSEIWLPELERLAGELRRIVEYEARGDAARGVDWPPDLDHRRRLEITIAKVAEFLTLRPKVVLEQAGEYLLQGTPGSVELTVDGRGEVRLNGYEEGHGFRGWYFPGTPLRFQAFPAEGTRFLRWEVDEEDAGSGELRLTAGSDLSVKAVFAGAGQEKGGEG